MQFIKSANCPFPKYRPRPVAKIPCFKFPAGWPNPVFNARVIPLADTINKPWDTEHFFGLVYPFRTETS